MFKLHRYGPALALMSLVGLAAPACAARTYGYGYPRAGTYGRDIERRAYDRGYREGLEQGRDDERHNRRYSLERHDEYRDADDGYRRGDGDREFYRRAYRAGFQAGYTEAYKRNAGYERGYPTYPSYPTASNRGWGTIGRDNGYREGFDAGRRDARDGVRYDPIRAMKRYYRDDSGYDTRYGSRDDYKRDYTGAFEQGYRDGYGKR
jgi:hypothetical protein